MDQIINQQKYRTNNSVDFADEIIFGKTPVVSNNSLVNSEIEIFTEPSKRITHTKEKVLQNYLLNISIVSFSLIAFLILLTKIVSITFLSINNLITSLFVLCYFFLFASTIYLISKRKMLSLKIKDETLHLKSFPALNQKIPVSQILKCELNAISNNKFLLTNKIQFALNENGNKYKLPLTSGIALQLINGNHIIIGSYKS